MMRLTFCLFVIGLAAALDTLTLDAEPSFKVAMTPLHDPVLSASWARATWQKGTSEPLMNASALKDGLEKWHTVWNSFSEEQRWQATYNNSVLARSNGVGSEYCPQNCPEWCWATCICIVKNQPCADECQYVSQKTGQQCCTGDCQACGKVTGTADDIARYTGGMSTGPPNNEQALQQSLAAGKQNIALIQWYQGGGHAIVVSGYSGGKYQVEDPLAGSATYDSFAQLMNYDGRGRWSGTVLV
ncbi:hypothetical protein CYMTET_20254 [Cymbomonas tetramitiformis]|uniref:Peptidase C39-like domain-containing protein n=1 Tax=Cymbomonas tetramitiformis TaxID=36881 RepID=A0AAE0G4H2_9CHLO|nr:hypothetical protein CYMTET_20254 [Cymbomonas tetramitiformis]|eukprot:gene10912-12910_t